MHDETVDTPVLIVGAGPVGLTTALALARFGIRSLVLERRRSVSPHPRARFVNARTMEAFRRLGIEDPVRSGAIPDGVASQVIWAPVLNAPAVRAVEIETLGPRSGEPISPSPGVCTSQDLLDPVLLEAVRATGLSQVHYGRRLTGLEQDGGGVTAHCEDAGAGTSTVRAEYLVGADGPESTVRELAGIVMEGPAGLGHSVNIHFRADLRAVLRGRPVNLAMILNPAQPGLLLNIDGGERWTAQAIISPARGESAEAFDADRCRAVVRAQVGDPDLAVEILGIAPWSSSARVAQRLSAGRVHLVGDAAQEMPPAGGFGMNTGIHEAENLAWKLAGVLSGWAAPSLLDTYEQERLPIARKVTQEAVLNLRSVGRVESADGSPPQIRLGRPEFFREHGLVFGATYASAATIPDGSPLPEVVNPVTDYVPNASPGARAPHAWIDAGGERSSTIDLCAGAFLLLQAGGDPASPGWAGSVPGRQVVAGDFETAAAYGLDPGGAVLVRPDGHVAWRSRQPARPDEVQGVLESLLGLGAGASAARGRPGPPG